MLTVGMRNADCLEYLSFQSIHSGRVLAAGLLCMKVDERLRLHTPNLPFIGTPFLNSQRSFLSRTTQIPPLATAPPPQGGGILASSAVH
jgi:hypothetical protein